MSITDKQVENATPAPAEPTSVEASPDQPAVAEAAAVEPAAVAAPLARSATVEPAPIPAAPAAEGRDRTALIVGAAALVLTLSAPYWTPTVYSGLNLRPHGIEWQARQQVETGRLSQTVAEMDRRLSEVSTLIENARIEAGKVQDIGSSVTAQLDAAMLLQFRAVIRQPVAFDAELRSLRTILPRHEDLEPLLTLIEPYASTGVPQTGQLFRELSTVINAVARTDHRPSVMSWLNSLAAWPQDLIASSGITSLNLGGDPVYNEPAAHLAEADVIVVEAAPADTVAEAVVAAEAVAAEAAEATDATVAAVEDVATGGAGSSTAPTDSPAPVAGVAPVAEAVTVEIVATETAPAAVAVVDHAPVYSQPIAERARQQLAANDLAGAVATLETLEGEAAQVARWWLDQARARLAADRLADQLAGIAVSVLGRVPPRA